MLLYFSHLCSCCCSSSCFPAKVKSTPRFGLGWEFDKLWSGQMLFAGRIGEKITWGPTLMAAFHFLVWEPDPILTLVCLSVFVSTVWVSQVFRKVNKTTSGARLAPHSTVQVILMLLNFDCHTKSQRKFILYANLFLPLPTALYFVEIIT